MKILRSSLYLLILLLVICCIASADEIVPAITLDATASQGSSPPNQSFHVQNDGGGMLNYIITSDQPTMIDIGTGFGGTTTDENNLVKIKYHTESLAVGTYVIIITVSDPLAINNPQYVKINLTITVPPSIKLS